MVNIIINFFNIFVQFFFKNVRPILRRDFSKSSIGKLIRNKLFYFLIGLYRGRDAAGDL